MSDGPFDQPEDLRRLSLFAKVYRRFPDDAELRAAVGGFSSSWNAYSQLPLRAVEGGQVSRWGTINPAEGGHTAGHYLVLNYRKKGLDGAEGFAASAYLADYDLKFYSDYSFFVQEPIFGEMVEQGDDRYTAGLQPQHHLAHRLGPLLARWQGGGGFRADALELWQVVQRRRYWPLLEARVREHHAFLRSQEELAWGPQWRLVLSPRADYFTFEVEDRLETAPQWVLPLDEWLRIFQIRDRMPRSKARHVPLVQPPASGTTQAALLSPKANLIWAAGPGLDLFANVGAGFHSSDARSAVLGQFVRQQSAYLARRGATPAQVEAVFDTLDFDPRLGQARLLPRRVGAKLGFRLQGSQAGSLDLGPSRDHDGGDVRFHAPAVRLAERFTLGRGPVVDGHGGRDLLHPPGGHRRSPGPHPALGHGPGSPLPTGAIAVGRPGPQLGPCPPAWGAHRAQPHFPGPALHRGRGPDPAAQPPLRGRAALPLPGGTGPPPPTTTSPPPATPSSTCTPPANWGLSSLNWPPKTCSMSKGARPSSLARAATPSASRRPPQTSTSCPALPSLSGWG